MPEELRVVILSASICFVCLIAAIVLLRSRTRSKHRSETGPVEAATKPVEAKPEPVEAAKPEPVKSEPVPTEARPPAPSLPGVPTRIDYEEDDSVEPTKLGPEARTRGWVNPPTERIVIDEDALMEEPTHSEPLILLSATAQTDSGRRRKRNEDSILAMKEDGLFVVADGMGGYRGGEIASKLAVSAIANAFATQQFPGSQHEAIPRRASELARAIQAANAAIFERAQQETTLEGMGTTVCAVRFSAKKQRLYVGHVGDSRVYRLRDGRLDQMTADHTMADHGVVGEGAHHLSRAVGIWPTVPIDILLGKPRPGDVYLLCSDGLTKMAKDEQIREVLMSKSTPEAAAEELIRLANANGGKDNISVVVVRVQSSEGERLAS